MGRFFDVLNTPIAVLVLLGVVAGINAFLYFGYRPSEAPAPPPADRGGPQTTVESTQLRTGPGEATRSASAPRSASPTRPSATASATTSATTSATASATARASSPP
jgi:cytoskeletal protein RodZ